MAKVDIHSDDYSDKPIDDDENPEWTAEDFAKAKPFKEVFPEQYAAWEANGRRFAVKPIGRPPVERPKVQIGFRLAQDVVERIRQSGAGYNARVEKVLREALDNGKF
jgi:uncharacterized protein (DUF4415 family)